MFQATRVRRIFTAVPYNGISSILSALANVVVVLGVPAFFYQQMSDDDLRQKQSTLSYINRYQSGTLETQRLDITLSWARYAPEIQAARAVGGLSSRTINDFVSGMISASTERDPQRNLQTALFSIVNFYDELLICVRSSVCDERLSERYFQGEAKQIVKIYGGWIDRTKESLSISGFGAGLRYFSGSKE